MGFNGNGVFELPYNWVEDAAAGINILADRMQAQDQSIADGLSITLTRDGQAAMEANLDMGNFKIVNLKVPTNNADAATKAYVDALIAGLGAAVTVGPAPPASPSQGQLWYKNVSPTGMFMWYIDVDSSQWIQVSGNGQGLEFASTAEARAGTATTKLMSPALAQARSGFIEITQTIAGVTLVLPLPNVPEITEIDLHFLNFTLSNAGANLRIGLNEVVAGYESTSQFNGTGGVGIANVQTSLIVGIQSLSLFEGVMRLKKIGSTQWAASHDGRRGQAVVMSGFGRGDAGGQLTQISAASSIGNIGVGSRLTAFWRI